jgi:hypothetical protein
MKRSSASLTDPLVDFAWIAWAELGVSGWKRRHSEGCIDPEALILLTGSLGDADPRLRDESLDWCARFRDLLSRSRLAFLHKSWPEAPGWREYASALSGATGERWPGAGAVHHPKLSGKSRLVLQDRPALVGLRLRAAFGATARTEVVRVLLLAESRSGSSAAEIAEEAGCTKRNAAEALVGLARAGLVASTRTPRADLYRISHRDPLEEVFGPLPRTRTSFLATCRAAWLLSRGVDRLASAPNAVRSVEARQVLSAVLPDLHRLGEPLVVPPPGREAWPALRELARIWKQRLASGAGAQALASPRSHRKRSWLRDSP